MNERLSRRARLLAGLGLSLVLSALGAFARDRHVLLDTDGDGVLNDCPNPAHNAKGSSNTDDLQYCSGGSATGKIIGTAPGRVSASGCTTGGGAAASVRNAALVDIDGDGATEPVYGHPQACAWNMAPSDSCEVHAGTYRKAGAGIGTASKGGSGSTTACDIFDCWLTSIELSGHGPNLNNNAYGTSGAPGFIRGAVMSGSTDTWDSDGDKIPDTVAGEPTSYPAILSGDRDGDGVFDATTCSGGDANSCTGDSFGIVQMGCGSGGFPQIWCGPNFAAGVNRGIMIDTDADGTFDQEITNLSGSYVGQKNVDNIVIKDLEFIRFNGGNGSTSGSERHLDGRINTIADGDGTGIVIDHVYQHNNDFPLNGGGTKSMDAEWADYQNGECRDTADGGIANNFTVYKNSVVEVNARYFFQNDNEDASHAGCSSSIHDNRIIMNVVNSPQRATRTVMFYIKAIDAANSAGTVPKVHRVYNNEFIIQQWASQGETGGVDLAAFGNGNGRGLGEIWFYGNLFRQMPGGDSAAEWWIGYCGGDGSAPNAGQNGRVYLFNNTWDWSVPMNGVCGHNGGLQEFLRERNNAYYGPTSLYADTNFGAISRANNCLSTSPLNSGADVCPSNTKSNWFADTSTTATWWNGRQIYKAKTGGDLAGRGSCDPDGDGVPGVDYDGDGVNDTSWFDLNGTVVSCPTLGTTIDVGAIQSGTGSGPGDTTPPGNVSGVTRTDARP